MRSGAAWPGSSEYSEAVQSPPINFLDLQLKAAEAVRTSRGLPAVWSGQFASVFKLRDSSRNHHAVRCFLKQVDERERRYQAIDACLRDLQPESFSHFRYLPSEILVRGKRYPILVMDWLAGLTLDEFLQSAHSDILSRLAVDWRSLVADLERKGIAHGDLQHGNILFDGGKFQLVDYDGMYVPALKGRMSAEIGHRNYQHPRRTESHFDEHMDRFSALVIFTSLVAISESPKLRGECDDSLLFKAQDYLNWSESAIVARVRREAPSAAVLLDAIRAGLAGPARNVESLETVAGLVRNGVAGSAGWWRAQPSVAPPPSSRRATPSWLHEIHSPPSPPLRAPSANQPQTVSANDSARPAAIRLAERETSANYLARIVISSAVVMTIGGAVVLQTEWGNALADDDVASVRMWCVLLGICLCFVRIRRHRRALVRGSTFSAGIQKPISSRPGWLGQNRAFTSRAPSVSGISVTPSVAQAGATRSQTSAQPAQSPTIGLGQSVPPASASPQRHPPSFGIRWQASVAPITHPPPSIHASPMATSVVASSGRWKYHRPTCEWAKKISPSNVITYPDSAAAERAGLAACHSCQP